MWVRLRSIQYISHQGRTVTHQPGEWVDVGRHQADRWLATGEADRPDIPNIKVLASSGVVANDGQRAEAILPGLHIVEGEPALKFEKTLLWDTEANLKPEFVTDGFSYLDTWEIAVPIASYTELARDIGPMKERIKTEAVIRDLRVPYYDPRVIFAKQCRSVRELLALWDKEPGDRRLAFLRALYQVKPLILALPESWVRI